MPLQTFIGLSAGAIVGAAVTYTIWGRRGGQGPPPADEPVSHPALRHGAPIKDRIRMFSSYVACFDTGTRNPVWTIEHLNKDKVNGDAKRLPVFKEDTIIPARFRSKNEDYKGSGLDRGHMVPFMDHKANQQWTDDTFYLTNISPQVGEGFNRDYWARFEKFVKDVTKRADDVFVVTGPVFAPTLGSGGLQAQHTFIGNPPNAVAVPTHFFKVVLAETKPDMASPRYAISAFAIPNRTIDPKTPLTSFVVPLDFLESVTGIEFFPSLLNSARRFALDSAAADWRRLGMAHQQALAQTGVQQVGASLPGSSMALVPAGSLPTLESLQAVSVTSGPPDFRPRPTSSAGQGAVHLCEAVACRLPAERFWEAASGKGSKKPSTP